MTCLRSALIGLVFLLACARVASPAEPASQDAPVPGGTAAFAAAVGIHPVPDRGRFMFELTRLVHGNPENRHPSVVAFVRSLVLNDRRRLSAVAIPNAGTPDLVPVPLNADVWGRAIFQRRIPREELVPAIVGDRTASLICHGLAALDDQTLAYFAAHEELLARLAERAPAIFAAFSGALHVSNGRVVVPGGARAPGDRDDVTPLWEAVVGEKVTRPDRFIAQLFEMNDGRVAYLFDVVGHLDPPRRAFALGLWMPDGAVRAERFRALATSAMDGHREWNARTMPFSRMSYDATMTLLRLSVDDTGRPSPPAGRLFWDRVFASADLPDDAARQLRAVESAPIDAAWLIESISVADARHRGERLDQLTFAQRTFATAPIDPDLFVAVRSMARYRMLALELERIGVTAPAVYAALARQAARVSAIDGQRGFVAQAQFQGAIALVARLRAVRTIDSAAAQKLIERIAALPIADGRFDGAVAEWVADTLVPELRAADSTEETFIAALGGAAWGGRDAPKPIDWEGHRYRLDLGEAERQRLRRVRERQGGMPIDLAMDLLIACRRLKTETLTVDDLESIGVRLTRLTASVPERSREEEEDPQSAGIPRLREARTTLQKAAEDVTRAVKNRDVRRAARIAEPLLELTDALTAQALLSFTYAAHAGDPDGALLLVDDVSRRHDFGLSAKDNDLRTRLAWIVPRQEVAPATPWHLSGSLLGLDVALAQTQLRRLNYERVLEAPSMTSNQRDGFAISVSLLDPYALTDADRDAIAAALEQGTRRLSQVATVEEFDAVADVLSMEGWRRRALRWTLLNERASVPSFFSASELLILGGRTPSDFDAWGMSIQPIAGCLCPRMPLPGRWASLTGRPQLGLTAAGVADVNVRVAIRLQELKLPAALARMVLSAAMQDFLDDAHPSDDADWLTLVRRATRITREQVEDYIAAATANGPLVPETQR